ncbi:MULTISPECIES: hypothetical protein [unclassified Peribacillus]|uniref:hypothetical protein n=1 Tax=unclassified Peribacillus TaxID=2675266 RepID=UPI00366B920C
MDQQTKEKIMELVSEALDKNAYVNIHFTQFEKTNDFKPVFKNDVESKAKELAEMLSVNVQETDSLVVDNDTIRFCFSYLPPENAARFMEEDVWIDESKLR